MARYLIFVSASQAAPFYFSSVIHLRYRCCIIYNSALRCPFPCCTFSFLVSEATASSLGIMKCFMLVSVLLPLDALSFPPLKDLMSSSPSIFSHENEAVGGLTDRQPSIPVFFFFRPTEKGQHSPAPQRSRLGRGSRSTRSKVHVPQFHLCSGCVNGPSGKSGSFICTVIHFPVRLSACVYLCLSSRPLIKR